MSLLKSFSFNCYDIKLINGDTFGYISGSGLTLWNAADNEKDYLPSSRHGFAKFAANHKYNLFACCEYGLDPQIIVYSYPDKEVLHVFESISMQKYSHLLDPGQLDVIDLFISRDGKRLLAVFGCPTYQIKFWDLETGEDFRVRTYKIDPKEYIKILFNPLNHDSFMILNKNSLVYCEMKPAWTVTDEENGSVLKEHQIEAKTFKKPKDHMPNEYTDAVWDPKKRLFVTDTICRLHVYNTDDVHANITAAEQETAGLDMSRQKYYYYKKEDARNAKDKEDDTGPMLRGYDIPLDYLSCAMMLTQKHLIIAKDNNFIEWYLLQTEDPEGRIELETEYEFQSSSNKILSMTYNHSVEKIYIATDGGEFFVLPIKAETTIEEEDEQEKDEREEQPDKEEQEKVIMNAEVEEICTSHSKGITFLKEVSGTSYLISAGLDGKILVWDGFEGKLVGKYISESDISCGDISPDGKILVIGTTKGCVKFFDITERVKPRLLEMRRIFKKEKEITQVSYSQDGQLVAVTGHSKRVFFMYGTADKRWKVYGKVKFQFELSSFVWCDKKMPTERPGLLAITNQGLLYAVGSPAHPADPDTQNVDFDSDTCPVFIRRTDFLLTKIALLEHSGEVIVTGKDRMLKKYKIPDENLLKTDPRSKPPSNPLEETPGHDLPITTVAHSRDGKLIVLGSQDGSVSFREANHFGEAHDFKAHNYKDGGVSAVCISQHGPFVYTGGNDGSIFCWSLNNRDAPTINNQEMIEDEELQRIDEEEDQFDEDIKHYTEVIADEQERKQEEKRIQVRKDIEQTRNDIQAKLEALLNQNTYADELEKLERDDFVIDLEGREKILKTGDDKRQEMKNEAQRENYKNEILYQKIKENTWDKMEVHLKGLVGIQSNTVLYNFQIRKRTAAEKRKLKIALDLRKMEMRERAAREEKKQKEVLQVETICGKPDAYIVNGLPGYKPLVLVDYEAKEDIPEPKREIDEGDKRVNRHADERKNRLAAARTVNRRQAQPQKKAVVNEEEEKKEEEKKNEQEDKEKKEKEENPDWDYLYGAFDLFTPNRKRTQIQILKHLIFKIKEKFNKEFEACVALRQQQVETITEKNNRIREILENLQQEVSLFKPRTNPFEKPDRILHIDPSEVGFERYLTKEEREKLEEERKKEEERLRLLRSDDAGIRAINQMMGGTLEEKKETPLSEVLVREEWMNKPLDDMNEEERMKLREFEAKEQKLKEEKEKIRKNLELELKKLKNDIHEICTKFDERIFILFRRRLEYEYRIYEQELFIIRLTLSILMEEENKVKTFNFERLVKDLYEKNEQLKAQKAILEAFKRNVDQQKEQFETEYKEALEKKGFPRNVVLIYSEIFENQKKDDKKAKDQEDWIKNDEFTDLLIKLDPFYELDKVDAKKIYDDKFQNYMDEINRRIENYRSQQDISETDKERFIAAFERKFQLRKQLDLADKEQHEIAYYNQVVERQQKEVEDDIKKKFYKTLKLRERLAKSVSNIELQVRFNQGQVEINQDEPIPRLADAILIKRSLIEAKNKEIKEKGHEKIEQMKANTNTKFEVEDLKHQTLIYEWKIRDIVAKTNEVKRLKVKKEWQVALTKKDQGVNQAELTKLAKQSQLLKEATEKRIDIYKKKEEKIKREIEYLLKENQQLSTQGHALGLTVKQRTDIAKMMDEKNEMKLAGDEGPKTFGKSSQTIKIDPESDKKFKEISQNKRLFELAKRQTEEIELLREELNRLKAKTFANFTNQVNKF